MRMNYAGPAAFLAAAGALLALAHPAAAQDATTPASSDNAITIRVGGYFTNDSTINHTVGSSFLCGGLDYDVKDQVGVTHTIVSADYISRSSGSNHLDIFPVTIGQMILSTAHNDLQPYYGLGLGAYFINQNTNNGAANTSSQDYAVFGGYAAAGFIYDRYLVVDARYHLVSPSHGINVDGLELTAGVTF